MMPFTRYYAKITTIAQHDRSLGSVFTGRTVPNSPMDEYEVRLAFAWLAAATAMQVRIKM
jgi:hypothetical protein